MQIIQSAPQFVENISIHFLHYFLFVALFIPEKKIIPTKSVISENTEILIFLNKS